MLKLKEKMDTDIKTASIIIKSCHRPIEDLQPKPWNYDRKSSCRSQRLLRSGGGDGEEILENQKYEPTVKSTGTQTDYRESETQTVPWEAPYKISSKSSGDPEILSLRNSTWGNGLPAGMHEVQIIKRMRIKRAWISVLPPMDTPSNIKICDTIISAIEANEWAFREAELQFIMDSRIELLERMKEEETRLKEEKVKQRLRRYANRLDQQREKKIREIRSKFSREIRKLNRKHRGTSANFRTSRSNIIERYANRSSQLYAPQMRFGFKSECRHEVLDKTLLSEAYVGGEIPVDDSDKWVPTDEELHDLRLSHRPEELCGRRTRWTDEKLKKLHMDLKSIRLNEGKTRKGKPDLLKRKLKLPPLPVTPLKKRNDYGENYWDSSSLFLQKIIRGRAIQCMMYEGRDRCRELIEELRSIHSLQDTEETSHQNTQDFVIKSLEETDQFLQDNRIYDVLDSLEGKTVSGMLDLLSKEEIRLREERKAHALVMLVERERSRREAEEAGRRQLERNRRRELDEMFRQMVKVHQDSIETYLEDIVNEGIEWKAEQDAKEFVEKLADEMDESRFQIDSDPDPTRDEELIANMVHNFLLPEVDKEIMRKKIRDRQQGYLREAHLMIHNEVKQIKSKVKSGESSREKDSEKKVVSSDDECVIDQDNDLYNEIKKLT